jgi:mannosidase alpha-like ER degradation enhancer 2
MTNDMHSCELIGINFPVVQTLIGEIDKGRKTLYNYHQVLRQFGFLPEMYDVSTAATKRSGYPLRPEFVESLFYMFRATRDPYLRVMAAEMVEAIEQVTKTECGYATMHDVNTHLLEDRMESFFLSETLKYLYLVFAPDDHFMLNPGSSGKVITVSGLECVIAAGGYIFNTEAHPVDVSCTDCCLRVHKLKQFARNGQEASSVHKIISLHPISIDDSSFCHSSSKDQFLHMILTKNTLVLEKEHELDYGFMTCPVQSLFSRFSLYGQVAKN